MKKILHVSSSPRGEASNSIHLANNIIAKLQARYPGSTLLVNDTVKKNYGHLNAVHPEAFKTPVDQHTPVQKAAMRASDEAVQELIDADIIVISLPLYNFQMPSALKAWIDHIVRPGLTVSYKTGKPEGLLQNKKAYLAIASNGVYSDGPFKAFDFSEPYLKFVLGFIGITDVTTYRVEGAGMEAYKATAVQKGLESVVI